MQTLTIFPRLTKRANCGELANSCHTVPPVCRNNLTCANKNWRRQADALRQRFTRSGEHQDKHCNHEPAK